LIKKAKQSGELIIITNAKKNWVYTSAAYLLPKTYQLLQQGINVVSARDHYEKEFGMEKWKMQAFLNLKKH
jgi:hypothetical protein